MIVGGIFLAEWVAFHAFAKPPPAWALVFNATWLLAIWSYLQTALTNPGTPASPEWVAWARSRQGSRTLQQYQKDAEEARVALQWPKTEDVPATVPRWCWHVVLETCKGAQGVYECVRVLILAPCQEASGESRTRAWSPGKPTWCRVCRMERPERRSLKSPKGGGFPTKPILLGSLFIRESYYLGSIFLGSPPNFRKPPNVRCNLGWRGGRGQRYHEVPITAVPVAAASCEWPAVPV